MSATIRPSAKADHEAIADLLIADAEARSERDPVLWALAADARARVLAMLANAGSTPFRQQWLVAEEGGAVVGVAHSILLPVPPIYAGAFGPPGLIMEDCHVAEAAPPGTRDGLLRAAEADLIGAGARILLASGVEGGDWARTYGRHGYEPLTMYFARSGLGAGGPFDGVRGAVEADVPGIVASSAVHREVLRRLHPAFWKPHAEADARFGGWMSRSLTLTDRDMFVAEGGRQGPGLCHLAARDAAAFPGCTRHLGGWGGR